MLGTGTGLDVGDEVGTRDGTVEGADGAEDSDGCGVGYSHSADMPVDTTWPLTTSRPFFGTRTRVERPSAAAETTTSDANASSLISTHASSTEASCPGAGGAFTST